MARLWLAIEIRNSSLLLWDDLIKDWFDYAHHKLATLLDVQTNNRTTYKRSDRITAQVELAKLESK